jgi:hypothetical protein
MRWVRCASARRRRILCWLLLDANGAVLRGRRDEPDVDRTGYSGTDRESAAAGQWVGRGAGIIPIVWGVATLAVYDQSTIGQLSVI